MFTVLILLIYFYLATATIKNVVDVIKYLKTEKPAKKQKLTSSKGV